MMRSLASVLAIGLLAFAPGIASANLLTNSGFETGDISGWTIGGSNGTYSAVGCANVPGGCAAGFGSYSVRINLDGVGSTALTQNVNVMGPGTYEFGAWVSLGVNPAAIAGNFSQGQVSLTAQGTGLSDTAGTNPNDLGAAAFVHAIGPLVFTDWILLNGTLTIGPGAADLLINVNVQNFDQHKRLTMFVDNAYIRAPAVPEPASLALLALGLLGVGAARRRASRGRT